MRRFHDRDEAGRALADLLAEYAGRSDLLVLALPRGGVPVAYQVALALGAPLDVFLVRKLGAPGQEELAMGAIASGGVRVLNPAVVDTLAIPHEVIDRVATRETEELVRRERAYRGDRPPPRVHGRTVILVDDGLATGSTMRAAVRALRQQGPARLVVAVPVGAPETCAEMSREVDHMVCALTPNHFRAVGLWYDDFAQTTDEEVRELLAAAGPAAPAGDVPEPGASSGGTRPVQVEANGALLEGDLGVPTDARGVVLFAHGSGSSRHSPRNRRVALALQRAGLATLLLDLLSEDEEASDRRTGHLRFDIDLLAARLVAATDWLAGEPLTRHLPLGYFGASTGGAAALVAAAERPDRVRAVVSRGGRPDLAGAALERVRAPTLLIVGELDLTVVQLNRAAMERITGATVRMELVPGASHLFEEPGALEVVAAHAADWLLTHLARTA